MRRLLPASRSWYALVVSAVLVACGGDDPTEPGGGGTTPATVTRASENTQNQTAAAGTAVANAPAVRVTDADGDPVSNVAVAFAVTTGGGTVATTSAQTNAQGIASAGSWTLGATAGAQRVTATVSGLTPVTFDATATAPVNLVASRVDVGGRAFKCVVRAGGVVACWGENPFGNLGDGTQTFRGAPVNLSVTGVTFASTALGTRHGCALTGAGAAYCWGENEDGVLGDGTTADRTSPVAVTGNHTFSSLAAGPTYTCGLKADGSVWCWGTQDDGAASSQRTSPTQLAMGGRTVTAISVSGDRVCGAVGTGGVMCWTGNVFAGAAPAVASTGLTFTALSGGTRHQCGLVADGRAYCWGFNAAGQLGTNDIDNRTSPTAVVGTFRFTAIGAGQDHTCALGTDGNAYCWGSNVYGQLGVNRPPTADGTGVTARAYPSKVEAPAGITFASIGSRGIGACGIAAGSGQVYCWGARAFNNAGTQVESDLAPSPVYQ